MSETLYRKYRPKNFSEIIGQQHIVQTLSNAVKNNRLGQAYLFTGPRGTGKTSIARILAKTINCTDLKDAITCEKCPACLAIGAGRSLDIIEIDAASNTGVDNIRELKETINLPPTSLKYKVYIIDEVHMLSIAAEGGMRDAESLLGQIISLEDKNITKKEVESILGTTDRNFAYALTELLAENNATEAIQKINTLVSDGYDLQVFNKTLINYLRQLMLLKISPELQASFSYEMTSEQLQKTLAQCEKIELAKILNLINLFLEAQNKISASVMPQLPLEIAIIKATQKFPEIQNDEPQEPTREKSRPTQTVPSAPATSVAPKVSAPAEIATEETPTATFSENANLTMDDVRMNWNKILEQIKPLNHSLQALLFSCQVFSVSGGTVTLATPYDFYKEKLNDPKNRLTVETVFGKILESQIFIKTVTNKEVGIETKPLNTQNPASKPDGQQDSLLTSAMEIMGGSVVQE